MAAPELAVLLRTCKHTELSNSLSNTTLAGNITTTSQTDVYITNLTGASVGMLIKVDDEIMQITEIDLSANPDEATVIRGAANTTAAGHNNGAAVQFFGSLTNFGYALKCDNASISYAKTPIQVPIPQSPPQIIDLGIYRPSISLSGTIETVGGDSTATAPAFEGMEQILYTRTGGYGASSDAKIYYIPYKNKLEDFAATKLHSTTKPIELEWGDASSPIGANQTRGAVYLVALQQFRVQIDATKEDRYSFSMQFVVGERKDSN